MSTRQVTDNVYSSLILDLWPDPAGVCDFGIVDQEHYGALQWLVKHEGVTEEEFDSVIGDGTAINSLIAKHPGNPYGHVRFHTVWDDMSFDEDADPDAEDVGQEHAVTCPLFPRFDGDIRGCGSTDLSGPDKDDFYTCRGCGLVFRPEIRRREKEGEL